MIMTDKLVEQIMAIRSSGAVNMFDAIGVQVEANKNNFFELVLLIEDNRKAYSDFILWETEDDIVKSFNRRFCYA